MKIRENCITELYDQANWPENLEVEPKEEAHADELGPYVLHNEVEEAM